MPDRVDQLGLIRLDDEECWAFLARHRLGRVGLVHLHQPLIFPVNYVLDGEAVVFRSAPGTKLALASIGTRAVFEVDEATELFESATSVMVHGAVRPVTDPDDLERVRRLPLRPWARGQRDHFMAIDAEYVSGRRIPASTDDDGLGADAG